VNRKQRSQAKLTGGGATDCEGGQRRGGKDSKPCGLRVKGIEEFRAGGGGKRRGKNSSPKEASPSSMKGRKEGKRGGTHN